MNEIEAYLLKKEFNRVFPQYKIEEMLGHGNFGTAFLTENNNVIKFTLDPGEVSTCKALRGRQNLNLCNIVAVDKFYFKFQKRSYAWILQERLFVNPDGQSKMKDSLYDFKHAWFTLFAGPISPMSNDDLQILYRSNKTLEIDRTRELLINYIDHLNEDESHNRGLTESEIRTRKENSLEFFDFINDAYHELVSICPCGRIDFNEGNFLFDVNGKMKVIDFQSTDI